MLCVISFGSSKFEGIANIGLSARDFNTQDFCCNLSGREVAFLFDHEQTRPFSDFTNVEENYKIQYYSTRSEYDAALKHLRDRNDTIFYYDRDTEQLTIFRDTFGVVPIFYHYIPGGLLVISDSIRDLVCCLKQNGQAVAINEEKLRAYLKTGIINVPYTNDTFFGGVKAVLPGYKVSFTSTEKSEERVVSFNVSQWKDACSTLDDFGNEFRRLFKDTVSRSIEEGKRIGVTLSGGLDSSSVASMIRLCYPDVPIASFIITDKRNKNLLNKDHDVFYSSEVSKHIGTEHTVIWKHHELLEDMERGLKLTYQPPLITGGYTPMFEMLNSMTASGVDVLVTGIDGDSIVGSGRKYLTTIFREAKWEELSEIFLNHPRSKKDPGFRDRFLPEFIYDQVRLLFFTGNFRQGLFLFFKSCKHMGASRSRIAKLIVVRGFGRLMPSFNRGKTILTRKSVRKSDRNGVDSVLSTLSDVPPDQQAYFSKILINHNVRLIEEYYALTKPFNIKARFPFFSKELYELCSAVPDKLNYFGGFGRGTMRHGLKGILLDSVRLRTNKSLGNEEALKVNTLSLITQAEKYLKADSDIWNFVNRKNLFYNLELVKKGRVAERYLGVLLFQIERVLFVAIWLAIVNADMKSKSLEKSESADL